MKNLSIEQIIYGDRSLYLSKINISKNKEQINPIEITKFLILLNENGYNITNLDLLFKLSSKQLEIFKEELILFLDSFNIEGIIFRKSFAKSIEQQEYTLEDYKAILAQYSLSYGWGSEYNDIFNESPKEILEEYFKEVDDKKISKLKTAKKEFKISFNYEEDLKKIVINILESKIVLREQQIAILDLYDIKKLEELYKTKDIRIKETEILIIRRLLDNGSKLNLFENIDQIVRLVAAYYSYYKSNSEKVKLLGQIKNSKLKELKIKFPTSIRKKIVKSLNKRNDVENVVEQMFKYYGFWKKIFTALKWQSEEKMRKEYINFSKMKDLLYKNDRSNTFNGKIENFKVQGDYESAFKVIFKNKGFALRNILEYLRYTKGKEIAQKFKKEKINRHPLEDEIDDLKDEYELIEDDVLFNPIKISDFMLEQYSKEEEEKKIQKLKLKEQIKIKEKELLVIKRQIKRQKHFKNEERIVKKDAINFIKSKEFRKGLLETNTKLLWQIYSLLEDEKIKSSISKRYVQGVEINYKKELPGIDEIIIKQVKKQVKQAIKTIKKEENKDLGNVYLSKELKDINIEFSGRKSKGVVLSGEYLTNGSKISFKDLVGKEKVIRVGIAWKGKESCDVDHSITLLNQKENIYYSNPTFVNKNNEVIISSSGDITENSNDKYSVELTDIDIDKVKEDNIGNMVSSIIQYRGENLDNYEVLWFMNIIDKKDRIINQNQVYLELDKMQYAKQLNETGKEVLGFFIDMENNEIELLNFVTKNKMYNMNVSNKDEEYKKILEERPILPSMYKVLKNVISKKQLVDNEDEADLLITKNNIFIENKRIINPNKEGEVINNIIY